MVEVAAAAAWFGMQLSIAVLSARNYQVIGVSPEIADLSVNLDARINGDPADRLIVATSLIKQALLITADGNLNGAGVVETIW